MSIVLSALYCGFLYLMMVANYHIYTEGMRKHNMIMNRELQTSVYTVTANSTNPAAANPLSMHRPSVSLAGHKAGLLTAIPRRDVCCICVEVQLYRADGVFIEKLIERSAGY